MTCSSRPKASHPFIHRSAVHSKSRRDLIPAAPHPSKPIPGDPPSARESQQTSGRAADAAPWPKGESIRIISKRDYLISNSALASTVTLIGPSRGVILHACPISSLRPLVGGQVKTNRKHGGMPCDGISECFRGCHLRGRLDSSQLPCSYPNSCA